jgi:YHS domain-containing protein
MKRALILRALPVLALCALLYSASSVMAQGSTMRVALKGHDPVAYFTERKAVKGDPKFSYDWDDGRYQFASARNREMFAANPERYAPQFGGYCTGSMSRGARVEADPEAWIIVDGRLYVFGQMKFKELAAADPQYLAERIPKADKNWREKK